MYPLCTSKGRYALHSLNFVSPSTTVTFLSDSFINLNSGILMYIPNYFSILPSSCFQYSVKTIPTLWHFLNLYYCSIWISFIVYFYNVDSIQILTQTLCRNLTVMYLSVSREINIWVFDEKGCRYWTGPVSYTHLDVYKRQTQYLPI